jgi:iron only hydrogenase large subunit-like protein
MGTYSGGGVIFGNSGGVCLATIRNLYRLLGIKNDFNKIKFVPMKKNQGLECSIKINQRTIKAAIISGAINVIKFIISKQYLNYDFIEIMACRGGCINGGGQPINDGQINLSELLKQRAEVLNTQDQKQIIARGRCSYDNDELLNFYLKMKITPNDKIAHKILHHHYSKND